MTVESRDGVGLTILPWPGALTAETAQEGANGALVRVDRRTEEAASILGADPWRVFRHVTLPLSMQGVFGGSAIVFSLTVGAYVTPRLLGGGRVQVLATEIYAQMLEIGDWGTAALLGVALTAVTLLGIVIYQLLARQPVVIRR